MGCIYCITCAINGKQYIGGTNTANPENRWRGHKKSIIVETGGCSALKEAFKKYGLENFTFQIMYLCFDSDTWKFEIAEILKHDTIAPNGYNLSSGGEATYGFLGKTHSAESKKLISEKNYNLGKLWSQDEKNELSDKRYYLYTTKSK